MTNAARLHNDAIFCQMSPLKSGLEERYGQAGFRGHGINERRAYA